MTITTPIYLFEYDIPLTQANLLNYCPGIWFWTLSPGIVIVTDDYGITGYYDTTNAVKYNIKSARYGDLDLIPVDSIDACFITDSSFYYDYLSSKIYFHFPNFEPLLDNKLTIGLPVGFSKNCIDIKPYFKDLYYPPRITKIDDIKKSMDRMFYGVPKYTKGKISLENNDGEFDDFGTRNLYNQPCRILRGDKDTLYDNYTIVLAGFIGDYSYNWESIEIEIDDVRKGLTQPVARNTFNQTDFVNLDDDDVGKTIPVIFGSVLNVPLICVNKKEITPTNYKFLVCDDEFFSGAYYIDTISNVYVNYKDKDETYIAHAISGWSGSGNIIYIPASTVVGTGTIADNLDNVTCDVAMNDSNGVNLVKYLIWFYEGKPFISTFWDTTETDIAKNTSYDTGIYISEGSKKLVDIIKEICNDIDGRFFSKWDGRYTIRLYDSARTPALQIYDSKWKGDPEISNNGSEYLSSCIIRYGKENDKDDYVFQYEEIRLKESAHNTYKKYKVETFETNLIDATDAASKGYNIMSQSYSVGDIVSRSVVLDDGETNFGDSLDLGDFIIGLPKKRITNRSIYGDKAYQYNNETLEVYEILGMVKQEEDNILKLTLRYVKNY